MWNRNDHYETLLDRLDLAKPDERTLETGPGRRRRPRPPRDRGPCGVELAVEPADYDHWFVSERADP